MLCHAAPWVPMVGRCSIWRGVHLQIAHVIESLDDLAPFRLAEPGDSCGLLVGDETSCVQRLLVALELTEPVFHEAVEGHIDAVVTHHPLLFEPVGALRESNPRERLLRGLVRHGITLIACHTNVDAAQDGLADLAAQALALSDISPLRKAQAGWYKFVGFIPDGALDAVAAAVFAAGAGVIGRYTGCAFSGEGVGSFIPGPGTSPAVGHVGGHERTPEVRWETVVPRERLGTVVSAFLAAHPYEEPAFDVYPVEDILPRVGLGRVGSLPEAVAVAALAERVAAALEQAGG
jgi:putative NIF3 family GTP cyclohydrolase 1 type 2